MSLLREFLRIDSDRRAALQALRNEATQRRARIDSLAAESKRKRDEISMLDEGLHRLPKVGEIERGEVPIAPMEIQEIGDRAEAQPVDHIADCATRHQTDAGAPGHG